MNWLRLSVLALASLQVSSPCAAQDEDEDTLDEEGIELWLACSYSDSAKDQSPSARLYTRRPTREQSTSPAVVQFKDGTVTQRSSFRVWGVDFAECLYPGGQSVRVKVGRGIARGYGMCGGNPEIFLTLWVNQRKLDSRVWYAGHCIEPSDLSYEIRHDAVTKCKTARATDNDGADEKPRATESVCVDFPDIVRSPIDEVEYPPPGSVAAAPGSVEIRSGDHAVCRAVRERLASGWDHVYGGWDKLSFEVPHWQPSQATLPGALEGAREGTFDFDNDGTAERVFAMDYYSNYMHGSVLLIGQPDGEGGRFLPCQLQKNIPRQECPPFSQKHDEAGLGMADPRSSGNIYFRGRYSYVQPFRYEGATFLAIATESLDAREYVGILKPVPDGSFEHTCLLRKVPENF